ncbi:MAG: hypothetical protein AAF478_06310, partial [Pseudomonadota bacterium]
MEQNLENLNTLLEMLKKGEFLEGMEKFFHDDVTIQEVGQEPKRGKEACLLAERELLSTVSEFIQYTALSTGAGEDRTYYEAVMEFKTYGGDHIKQQQVV